VDRWRHLPPATSPLALTLTLTLALTRFVRREASGSAVVYAAGARVRLGLGAGAGAGLVRGFGWVRVRVGAGSSDEDLWIEKHSNRPNQRPDRPNGALIPASPNSSTPALSLAPATRLACSSVRLTY
jgi:hypothetical protein